MSRILNPIKGVYFIIQLKMLKNGLKVVRGLMTRLEISLRKIAQRYPDKLAFISDERNLTFQELDHLTERLGAALLKSWLGNR